MGDNDGVERSRVGEELRMPFAQLPVSTPRPVRARSSEEPSRVPATRAQFLFGSLDLVCELLSVPVTWRARRRCRLGEISLYFG